LDRNSLGDVTMPNRLVLSRRAANNSSIHLLRHQNNRNRVPVDQSARDKKPGNYSNSVDITGPPSGGLIFIAYAAAARFSEQ
jgi:hypothetical protein